MPNLELFGTASCPYTSEMREWLEWKGSEFTEYDVEADSQARERMHRLAQPPFTVPLLVEDGKVIQVGWQGRGCVVTQNNSMPKAYSIQDRGVVQGVGFRPFVYRLARANNLKGWVLNAEEGVEIHLEGEEEPLQSFLARDENATAAGRHDRRKSTSNPRKRRVSRNSRFAKALANGGPPFEFHPTCRSARIVCKNSSILRIAGTTIPTSTVRIAVRATASFEACRTTAPTPRWPLAAGSSNAPRSTRIPPIAAFTRNPSHAPPVDLHYFFQAGDEIVRGDEEAVRKAAHYLRAGKIVAVKGLGGYHLACDATNMRSRQRPASQKIPQGKTLRRDGEKPGNRALRWSTSTQEAEALMNSVARPIVLARAKSRSAPESLLTTTNSA